MELDGDPPASWCGDASCRSVEQKSPCVDRTVFELRGFELFEAGSSFIYGKYGGSACVESWMSKLQTGHWVVLLG
jgi:hypothetical protein